MRRTTLQLGKLALLVLMSVAATHDDPGALAAPSGHRMAYGDYLLYQVRVRKVHLARPDLIHYPLPVDVVC